MFFTWQYFIANPETCILILLIAALPFSQRFGLIFPWKRRIWRGDTHRCMWSLNLCPVYGPSLFSPMLPHSRRMILYWSALYYHICWGAVVKLYYDNKINGFFIFFRTRPLAHRGEKALTPPPPASGPPAPQPPQPPQVHPTSREGSEGLEPEGSCTNVSQVSYIWWLHSGQCSV